MEKEEVDSMKKRRIVSLLLCLAMTLGLLSGCQGGGASGGETYRELYSGEITTLNYLVTGSQNEQAAAANFIDTLVEYDQYGVAQPCLAESWEHSDDMTVWTFHLRDGLKWVDASGNQVADVTAQDWVDAAEYVLDASNASSTASAFYSVIANAEEYFNYTAYLLESENGTKTTNADGEEIVPVDPIEFSQVGVKAIDEKTLEYTLKAPTPYFLSYLVYVCFMPVNGDFLEQQGENFGVDNNSILYNGAYTMTTFSPQAQRIYTKNENYWDKDKVYLNQIVLTYNEQAATLAPAMYQRGEIDYASIGAEILDSWLEDPATKDLVSPSRPGFYSYFYAFNFDPQFDEEYEPENWKIAVNNENFRKSLFYGLDRIRLLSVKEPYDPESKVLNTITPKDFADLDGTDYSDVGALAEINARDSFQEDAALEYAAAAKEELAAAGATFPIKVLVPYLPTDTEWTNECQLLEQQLEGLLGADYIDIIVQAGPSTGFLSAVRRSGNFAFLKCNWGPDYADPETYTDPFVVGGTYNKPEMETTGLGEEYNALVDAAQAERVDLEARYIAFAEAEAFLINHAIVIPYGLEGGGYKVSRLNVFEAQYSPFGVSELRYKGQHLLDKPMSMDEFNAAYETWRTERAEALAAAGQ